MDKRIVFAVAGSGKTSLIIDRLNLENPSLIVTYTKNNLSNLRNKITNKFGCIPSNIRLYSYFEFLHSFCYRPFLALEIGAKGINWNIPPAYTMRIRRDKLAYYLDSGRRLYYNRIAKLLEQKNLLEEINLRIEKYFSCLFIDEVQDFAGHDFNFLSSLCQANIETVLVGDYYQHTFDTSRDGNVNASLHNDYEKYVNRFRRMGLHVDNETLIRSYRCSPDVCNFISDKIGIEIRSHRDDNTIVKLIEDEASIDEIYKCDRTVKLFYDSHYKYSCYSQNWGPAKGEDHYADVCVVLNQSTYRLWKSDNLHQLNPKTKNKFYVACSRARGNLFFIPESALKQCITKKD